MLWRSSVERKILWKCQFNSTGTRKFYLFLGTRVYTVIRNPPDSTAVFRVAKRVPKINNFLPRPFKSLTHYISLSAVWLVLGLGLSLWPENLILKNLCTCIPVYSPVKKKIVQIFDPTKQQKHAYLKLERVNCFTQLSAFNQRYSSTLFFSASSTILQRFSIHITFSAYIRHRFLFLFIIGHQQWPTMIWHKKHIDSRPIERVRDSKLKMVAHSSHFHFNFVVTSLFFY